MVLLKALSFVLIITQASAVKYARARSIVFLRFFVRIPFRSLTRAIIRSPFNQLKSIKINWNQINSNASSFSLSLSFKRTNERLGSGKTSRIVYERDRKN